jgi:hypothetical protein
MTNLDSVSQTGLSVVPEPDLDQYFWNILTEIDEQERQYWRTINQRPASLIQRETLAVHTLIALWGTKTPPGI